MKPIGVPRNYMTNLGKARNHFVVSGATLLLVRRNIIVNKYLDHSQPLSGCDLFAVAALTLDAMPRPGPILRNAAIDER